MKWRGPATMSSLIKHVLTLIVECSVLLNAVSIRTHTHNDTKSQKSFFELKNFWNTFLYSPVESHSVSMNTTTKKAPCSMKKWLIATLRARMYGAIKLFSKGFETILSSVCARWQQMDGQSHSPELIWQASLLNVSACCSHRSVIVKGRLSASDDFKGPILHPGEPLPNTFMTTSVCVEPRIRKTWFALSWAEKKKPVQRQLSWIFHHFNSLTFLAEYF